MSFAQWWVLDLTSETLCGGRSSARATCRSARPQGAVPDGLVASYDAEARAYNPDHDVYILAY